MEGRRVAEAERLTPVPAETPPVRLGPRPLALHLATAMASGVTALAALPAARAGRLPWAGELAPEAAALAASLAGIDPSAFAAAVVEAQSRRLSEVLAGVRAYHAHPFRRALSAPEVAWREGSTRLLDYGGHGAVAALFVPSLINRYYVLDLLAERSLLRWLAGEGVRVLALDWDAPGPAERAFGLDDYIVGRLGRAIDRALEISGRPLAPVGYCLGGNLALAAAARRQSDLAGLALLATPWDFHAGRGAQASLFGLVEGHLELVLQAFGELPVDLLQALFAWLDPTLAQRKFRRFAAMRQDSAKARAFVALEDWLNDGVPLAPRVARQCLVEWYGRNTPPDGGWSIAGRPVRPQELALPCFVAIPDNDRIVPPASAQALAEALPAPRVVIPKAGHIGMIVGQGAVSGLWRPLAEWLRGLAK
jgi:poly[(R)-3-hydroxyalkanoate] polymerase subunit PhaC